MTANQYSPVPVESSSQLDLTTANRPTPTPTSAPRPFPFALSYNQLKSDGYDSDASSNDEVAPAYLQKELGVDGEDKYRADGFAEEGRVRLGGAGTVPLLKHQVSATLRCQGNPLGRSVSELDDVEAPKSRHPFDCLGLLRCGDHCASWTLPHQRQCLSRWCQERDPDGSHIQRDICTRHEKLGLARRRSVTPADHQCHENRVDPTWLPNRIL